MSGRRSRGVIRFSYNTKIFILTDVFTVRVRTSRCVHTQSRTWYSNINIKRVIFVSYKHTHEMFLVYGRCLASVSITTFFFFNENLDLPTLRMNYYFETEVFRYWNFIVFARIFSKCNVFAISFSPLPNRYLYIYIYIIIYRKMLILFGHIHALNNERRKKKRIWNQTYLYFEK